MNSAFIYALLSTGIVSGLSLVGVLTFVYSPERLLSLCIYFISFASGALVSNALLHLHPYALNYLTVLQANGYMLFAIVLFFILEKIIHVHREFNGHAIIKSCGIINLAADALHNFIDGIAIGTSFLVNVPLGVATTIAVVLHEIPQEFSDFTILLFAGFSRKKALMFNFFSALTSFAGVFIVFIAQTIGHNLLIYLLPITAGGFIYVALTDLLPELFRHNTLYRSTLQVFLFIAGIICMTLI